MAIAFSTLACLATLGCGRIGYDDGEFVPSNDVAAGGPRPGLAEFVVTQSLRIHTDSGAISTSDGATLRAAGPGVIAGIRFESLPGNIGLVEVAAIDIAAQTTVRAHGVASLILLSAGDVAIAGVLDVSAGLCADETLSPACGGPGGFSGSGRNGGAKGCAPGDDGVADGDTGGGGGGFGQDGAPGGDETDEMMMPGGRGGLVTRPLCSDPTLVPLMGGSGGGRDGGGISLGGGSGGAIQISSFTRIVFTGGGINASGAGGEAGGDGAGGSGGGSGGGILLEAPIIDLGPAVLAANGGGGGEGNGEGNGATGVLGDQPAAGGATPGNGRSGGAGGAGDIAPAQGDSGINDTGGGGGGVGLIRLNAGNLSAESAVVSPPASIGTLPAPGRN